jgi:DNA modification methylase
MEAPRGIQNGGDDWLVPVQVGYKSENDSAAMAYLAADNKLTELGGWNEPALAELLQEIHNSGEIAIEATGFDADGLDELLRDLGMMEEPTPDPGAQVDRAAELQEKWQVQRGDVWQVGRHRVMCGDSTSAEDVDRLMGGVKMQGCFTSPPYFNQRPEYSTFKTYEIFNDFLSDIVDNIISVSDDVFVLMWNTGDNQPDCLPMIADQTTIIHSKGLTYLDTIIWRKSGAVYSIPRSAHIKSNNYYYPALAWEPLIIFRKGEKMPKFNPIDADYLSEHGVNVWDISQVIGSSQQKIGHPAIYPVELVTRGIKAYSNNGNYIFDPFLGSGTTIVACEQTGRIGYGMEIAPEYVAVTLDRLSGMGLTPERIDDE